MERGAQLVAERLVHLRQRSAAVGVACSVAQQDDPTYAHVAPMLDNPCYRWRVMSDALAWRHLARRIGEDLLPEVQQHARVFSAVQQTAEPDAAALLASDAVARGLALE